MVVAVVDCHESKERVQGIEDYLFLASGTAPIMHKYINLSATLCMNYPTISNCQEDSNQLFPRPQRIRQIGKRYQVALFNGSPPYFTATAFFSLLRLSLNHSLSFFWSCLFCHFVLA